MLKRADLAMQSDASRAGPDSATTGAPVSARNVSRVYGAGEAAVHALREVSVDIAPRRLTAVMGASGSGKSTLMHILAGLDRPTSGSVTVEGTDVTAVDDDELTLLRRRHIGFVFQFFNLLPMLTAEENVLLPLAIAGRKPDREWLDEVVDAVGIRTRLTYRPAELSGGQQQRVAVARALITRPTIVFADEPTGNLDSGASAAVLGLLRRAVDDFGQTIAMVTHDAGAAAIADELLFLADGRVVKTLGRSSRAEVLTAMNEVTRR